MLSQLASPGSATHAEVLYGASETGELVSFEMGSANESVCMRHITTDVYLLVNGQIHRYCQVRVASKTVGNGERSAGHSISKPIFNGCSEVVHAVGPRSHIKCIRVGKKRFSSQVTNSIHQVTEVSGWDVSRIALLSKVELNGNEVPFFDNFIKASYIQQPIQLDVKVLLQTGPQIHGIYFTGH